MGIQLAPIEGTPYAGGTATGVIYLDANGLQRSDGPTVDASGNVTADNYRVGSPLGGYYDNTGVYGLETKTDGDIRIKNNTDARLQLAGGRHGTWHLGIQGVFGWSNGNVFGTVDTALSRISAGVIGVGTGALGSVDGTLSAGILTATAPAITDTPLAVNGSVGQTADIATFGTGAKVTADAEFSNNGSETGSESFGAGAVATGSYATLIGNTTTGAAYTVAGGYNTRAAENSVVFGHYGGQFGFHSACVLFGQSASSTTTNQFVAGSQYARIDNVYFGEGVSNATPTAYTINGTGGSGTDIAGADINIAGGIGRGTGVGGSVELKTASAGSSGSTANTLATRMKIDGEGAITFPGIPTSDPGVTGVLWSDSGTLKLSP